MACDVSTPTGRIDYLFTNLLPFHERSETYLKLQTFHTDFC